jgi:malate dehydrogenase (quinone)
MVPSLGTKLAENPRLFDEIWSHTTRVLQLDTTSATGRQVAHSGTV